MGIGGRLSHAWNAFRENEDEGFSNSFGGSISYGPARPDRIRLRIPSERSIVASIYNRISLDFSGVSIRHVKVDEDGRFISEVDSGLNNCFKFEANIDQAASHFRQDICLSLCENGVIAIVPVDTTLNPSITGGYDIQTLRVGTITRWMPKHVRVNLYNEAAGKFQEITLEKKYVAIVENPLYSVMNEPNSTLQRLVRKLALLDSVDEQASSGKLDLIIQLPYVIKSDARKTQAENRRGEIEHQLRNSKYGIAYTDGTEKITQLNRPVENNLMKQVETLTTQLYSELGLTPEILNGTATELVMTNYMNRTIKPMLVATTEAMIRTFLTKTARTQNHTVKYFLNPFGLVPVTDIAEVADKFTRNEIMTSNEIRQIIGYKPVNDPKADELRNSNMPQPEDVAVVDDGLDSTSAVLDSLEGSVEDTIKQVEEALGGSE